MSLVFVAILGLILFLFGYTALRANPSRKSNLYFFLFILLVIIWIFSNQLSNHLTTYTSVLLANRLIFTSTSLLIWVLFLFSTVYPDEKRELRGTMRMIGRAVTLIVAVMGMTPLIVAEVALKADYSEIEFGAGITLYVAHFAICFILFLVFLFSRYRSAAGIERLKMQYLLVGLSLSTFGAIFTNLFLPLALEVFNQSNLGPAFLLIFVGFTFITIIRHRFLGIRILIGQALYFVFISLFTLFGFFFFNWLLTQIFGSIRSTQSLLSSVVIAPIYTWVFLKYNVTIERLIKEHFIYIHFNPSKALELFLKKTRIILDTDKIAQETVTVIQNAFDIENVGMAILDPKTNTVIFEKTWGTEIKMRILLSHKYKIKDILTKNTIISKDELDPQTQSYLPSKTDLLSLLIKSNTQMIIPLGKDTSFDGFIALGPKPSYAPYTTEDITFLINLISNTDFAIERSLLYNEVQQFNLTLQDKVNSATKQLKIRNKELQDLYNNLEEIYQKEKDLMDVAGHEFRTPASILKNNLYLLRRRLEEIYPDTDPKVQQYIDRLVEGTDRQISLINTFLESARIDNKRFEIQVTTVDLNELLATAVTDLTQFSAKKGLRLMYDNPGKKIFVEVDPTRIREVIDNLVNNAIKYTKRGYIRISISEDKDHVSFSVSDSGIGISKDDIPLLFRKFSRVENYIGGEDGKIVRPGGTGLGLYVAKTILDAHSGTISVQSELDKGSTFTCRLPYKQPSYVRRVEAQGNNTPNLREEKVPAIETGTRP